MARAITQAIEFAESEGVDALVINISGGQLTHSGEAHPLLTDVIRKADRNRILIVAAAGNQGCDCLHIPGAIPPVLAVGAMDNRGRPLDFSNWGSTYQTHGVLAPGENIRGAAPSGGISVKSGTSYSTPIVSGVAALLLCLQRRLGIRPSAAMVREIILRSALGCDHDAVPDCRRLLAGRLNIHGAFALTMAKGADSMNQNSERRELDRTDGVIPQTDQAQPQFDQVDRILSGVVPALPTAVGFSSGSSDDSQISPSDCGCGGKKNPSPPQKVYAIGKLGFDYGTRQKRDYFSNRFANRFGPGMDNPDSPTLLYRYLTGRQNENHSRDYTILNGPQFTSRQDVTALTWTLMMDDTPVYAILPVGSFAFETHDTLVAFLKDQMSESDGGESVERMSVPGLIVGETRLYTGETVPVLAPDHRGLANWTTAALLNAIGKNLLQNQTAEERMREILGRMYELTRNLGVSPQDRALNYAATDALRIQEAIQHPLAHKKLQGLELDDIRVDRSPICRPDYDCWDVVITFFDPNNLQRARHGVRYTIDVSDVMPNILNSKSGQQRELFTIR